MRAIGSHFVFSGTEFCYTDPVLHPFILFILAASALTACYPRGVAQLQTRPTLRKFVKPETADRVSWQMVAEVLDRRCTTCHGTDGGVNLESYEGARRHRAEIDNSVFRRQSMPPKGRKMTTAELEILAAWLDMGAPMDPRKPTPKDPTPAPPPTPVDPPPTPTPVDPPPPRPPPPALEPTFESIMNVIVKPKCLECHRPEGDGFEYPMRTLEEWLDPMNEIVLPGDVENSRFIRSVRPTAKKIMPPKKTNLPPLTPAEIEIISEWISRGAKD